MLEPAVFAFRLLQYGATAVLFGTSLFFLYALPRDGAAAASGLPWPRRVLAIAAVSLLLASGLGLIAQTGVMAGSLRAGLEPSALHAVATGMGLGRAALVRAAVGLLALAALALIRPSRALWTATALLGGGAAIASAWMGHAGATEGTAGLVHLGADILHILAACVWIGALVAFLLLLMQQSMSRESREGLHRALHGFSGVGSAVVAVLVLTGAINSWILIGPSRVSGLWTTPYGLVLSAKLALFGLMLLLAAANRWRLTPALRRALDEPAESDASLRALRRSLVLETAAAFALLILVAWLGMLVPVAAQ